MTMTISPGKARGLQACATARGTFIILAVDHRDSLQAMTKPDEREGGSFSALKLSIVRHLAPTTSAVLLDPIYSAAQAIASGALPGNVALLSGIEEENYLGDTASRQTARLAGWSVEKAKRLGASGVKVLFYYHPDGGAVTEKQERFVRGVVADCRRYDIPFFLEPMSYSLDRTVLKASAEFASQRPRVVIESVRRLTPLEPDVLKVEFPLDVRYQSDRAAWHDACARLNMAAGRPWALLSADEPFDIFKQQLRVACEEGCSGLIAGRAVWREAAALTGTARDDFLENTARPRLIELGEIADKFGTPWHSRYTMPAIDENWHLQY